MDKVNNKKLKQYKKKLTTKGRVDMSKGGRVKAQRGGLKRRPVDIEDRPNVLTTTEAKFIPGQTSTRRGAAPTPPEGKLKQVGNPLPELSQAEKDRRQKLAQARIDANKKLMEQNPLKPVIQNLDNQRIDSPKPIQPMPKKKPIQAKPVPQKINYQGTGGRINPPKAPTKADLLPPKQPPMSVGGIGGGRMMTGREELELANQSLRSDRPRNAQDAVEQTSQAFQRSPTTGKGSDQMFIGRESEVRPQAAQPTSRGSGLRGVINKITGRGGPYEPPYNPPYTPPGTPPGTPPVTPPTDGTITGTPEQLEAERGKRVIQTGRTAEQIAAGEIPEGMIPTAEVEKISMEGTEADTVQLDPTQGVTATTLAQEAPEDVALAEAKKGVTPDQIKAVTIDDVKLIGEDEAPEVTAAIGGLSNEAIPRIQKAGEVSPTEAAKVAQEEIDKALAPEVRGQVSPESLVQALDKRAAAVVAPVDDATVATRTAEIISEKQKTDILSNVTGEGVNLEDIPQFNVVGKRTAQVAEANTRIAQELGTAPSMDADERAAITSDGIAKGDAAQIGGVPTLQAASRQAVTGTARKTAAADMLAVVGEMPEEVTAAILEDPATVEAQMDTQPVNVQAAVAALPKEALVSTQMEGLLAGIEENKTPAWARPAVDAVNAMLAQRGMSASTVGRDSLFNAIIQSALPIAQSNAQALQQRASQNLSNEQQANLQQANQVMQQRMTNLANRQTAASQTAQMAQQVVLKQGEFEQQAVLTTSQQEQQVRMQNIQNEQQKASQESAQRQQVAIANLDTATKIDLANLEQLNAAGRDNLTADQQTRLAEFQAKVDRNARQAELEQRMEEVNLSNDLKVELANLTEKNQAARESMTAENQMRLANLNVLVDFKKTNANLAQQMDLANMSAENQMELAMLQERAAADSANFTEANKFRLQELTTAANVLSQNAELKQRAEFAKLSAEEKIALANLTAKNQADSENMSAENQIELANLNKKMRTAEVNANLAQQLGLAELSNAQEAAMTNAQINANMDMANFNAEQQTALANSKFMQSATLANFNAEQQAIMQDATSLAAMDLANLDAQTKVKVENARNFLALDMANLNNEQQSNILKAQQEQQRLLSNQSFENAAAQFNAASENDVNKFMAGLNSQMSQFNASQANAMAQFNTTQENAAEARRVGMEFEANKIDAQLATEVDRFNAQQEFAREQFNTQNETVIAQSNVQWRRQANTANTAALNAVNQQNAQNAFGMTASAMNFLWQQLRDEADFAFRSEEGDAQRKASLMIAALGNEGATAQDTSWSTNLSAITKLVEGWLD